MQIRSLPPSFGLMWFIRGFELARVKPALLFSWFVFIGTIEAITNIHLFLSLAYYLITPLLFLVSITLCHNISQHQYYSGLQILKTKFTKENLFISARFCFIYFLLLLALAIVVTLVYPLDSVSLVDSNFLADPNLPADAQLDAIEQFLTANKTLFTILLYSVLVLTALTINSIPLVGWHQLGITQALRLSAGAVLRNGLAYLIFYGLFFAIFKALSLSIALIAPGLPSGVQLLLFVVSKAALMCVLVPGIYYSYVTSFEPDNPMHPELR